MNNSKDDKPSFFISYRFLLAVIAFVGYATQYAQKINLSVAIVCMVNSTALPKENVTYISTCQNDDENIKNSDGQFIWSKSIQGLILASYFVGYLISGIPGGWLSLKFGPKLVLTIAILISSLFTIVLPFSANLGYGVLIACRFIIGLAHGVLWPAFSGFWSAWAPNAERSRLIGFANAGSQIGNVITLPLGGYLCDINQWETIFYTLGGLGIVWVIAWMFFSSNSPSQHRMISQKEKNYIEQETRETIEAKKQRESSIPWLKIMTSKACYALFVAHITCNWGTYLYLTTLPTYMKEVLKFDIKSNGLLSALPYIMLWLFILLSGVIGDKLIDNSKKNQSSKINKKFVRNMFNSLSFLVPMCAVIGLIFVTCSSKYLGVVLLTIGLAFVGCGYGAGFAVNYNDVSGVYSSIVFGIGNTLASVPGIVAPYFVGYITKDPNPERWRIVFIITAVFYLIGTILSLILTSVELEPWAKKDATKDIESIALKQIN